jgi:hypothetical protein
VHTVSLVDHVVTEGLATAFEHDFGKADPPWGKAPPEVMAWTCEVLDQPATTARAPIRATTAGGGGRSTKANRPDPFGSSLSSHGRFATPVGIEGRENLNKDEENATNRDVVPVPAETIGEPSLTPDPKLSDDPDAALKSAIKAALDAGLFDRARALLDVLAKTSAVADVVDLRGRRR